MKLTAPCNDLSNQDSASSIRISYAVSFPQAERAVGKKQSTKGKDAAPFDET